MIAARVKVKGVTKLAGNAMKRKAKAERVKELSRQFWRYMLGDRWDNMWRHQGVVKGRWGKGSWKWPRNAQSTIRQKGFDKPLYGRTSSSGLEKAPVWRCWTRHRGKQAWATYSLRIGRGKLRKISEYNHYGTEHIPPRPHAGFIPGDIAWLNYHGRKDALNVGLR